MVKQRIAALCRATKETDIAAKINLDGSGICKIETGIGFFDHMLTLLAAHSKCDLEVTAKGDTQVDGHHTVEDVAIVIGKIILDALGDKVGIERAASEITIMDDSVVEASIDFGGRSAIIYDSKLCGKIGEFDAELVKVFFDGLSKNALMNIYVSEKICGNKHHTAEAVFKCFARCLKRAVKITGDSIPSSKGVI